MKPRASWSDAHRGQIVVGTAFVTLAALYGVWYSYAVFLVALTADFGWSRSLVAGAFSLFVLVHASVGPAFGPLAERLGPRRVILLGGALVSAGLLLAAQATRSWHLYAAFGMVTATGIGLSGYVPLVVFVRGWFPGRTGTAVGIASAGIGLGIALLAPLSQVLIDHFGWRWAFRSLAVLVAVWILPASLWLLHDPPAPARPAEPASRRPVAEAGPAHWTMRSAATSPRFWGLCAVFFCHNAGVQLLMVHQVAYLVDHGVSALTAATVGGIVGLVSVGGKAWWGFLMDRSCREKVFTLASICLAASVGLLGLSGSHPASALPYVYAIVLGLGYSVTAPAIPTVSGDLFGGPGFSVIFGFVHVAVCLGTATGAWAGGRIFDQTGSYAGALWGAVAVTALACALLWLVAPRRPNPVCGQRTA
jgi:MFS family permease